MKLKIPTDLSEITLEQAQKFLIIEHKDGFDDRVRWLHAVAIFSGVPMDELRTAELDNLKDIYLSILALLNKEEDSNKPPKNIFTYKKVKYGFIPNLREITAGEFTDLDSYITSNMIQNLHKIMAVLYRPINHQVKKLYTISDYNNEPDWQRQHRQQLFQKNMTYDYVRSLTFFLSASVMKLSNTLQKEQSKKGSQAKRKTSGAGSTSSIS